MSGSWAGGSGIQFPAVIKIFFSSPKCACRLWTPPSFLLMDTGASVPANKAAGTWSRLPISIQCRDKEWKDLSLSAACVPSRRRRVVFYHTVNSILQEWKTTHTIGIHQAVNTKSAGVGLIRCVSSSKSSLSHRGGPGFNFSLVHGEFVVDKVALGQASLRVLWFSRQHYSISTPQ
jgi:hypothetical protein